MILALAGLVTLVAVAGAFALGARIGYKTGKDVGRAEVVERLLVDKLPERWEAARDLTIEAKAREAK